MKPLNENAQLIDSALQAIAGKTLMIATGEYHGQGGKNVSISTPGFKPCALLMRVKEGKYLKDESDESDEKLSLSAALNRHRPSDSECTGFTMWIGKDLNVKYWYEDGLTKLKEPAYTAGAASIAFTPKNGGLDWELSGHSGKVYHHGLYINNAVGDTYEWIAFGFKEGT